MENCSIRKFVEIFFSIKKKSPDFNCINGLIQNEFDHACYGKQNNKSIFYVLKKIDC